VTIQWHKSDNEYASAAYLGHTDIGVWRDLNTGVNPAYSEPTDANGALDQTGDPGAPIDTRLEGGSAIVLPWWEGYEDPESPTGLTQSMEPTYPDESVGWQPIAGAYDGNFRTVGPVRAFGYEDQAMGRIMRFPANVPDRYDTNGVWNTDYMDELAAIIANNNQPLVTEAEYTTSLLLYPNF